MGMEDEDEISQEEIRPFAAALRFFTQGEYKKTECRFSREILYFWRAKYVERAERR